MPPSPGIVGQRFQLLGSATQSLPALPEPIPAPEVSNWALWAALPGAPGWPAPRLGSIFPFTGAHRRLTSSANAPERFPGLPQGPACLNPAKSLGCRFSRDARFSLSSGCALATTSAGLCSPGPKRDAGGAVRQDWGSWAAGDRRPPICRSPSSLENGCDGIPQVAPIIALAAEAGLVN